MTVTIETSARRLRHQRGWVVSGAALAVLSAGWGGLYTLGLTAHRTSVVETRYDASAVRALSVDGDAGSIHVVPATGPTIRVRVRIDEGLRRPEVTQALVGGTLTLRSRCRAISLPWCSASYEVEVPPSVSATLRSETGDIVVQGIDGPLDVRTDVGDVRVDGGRPPEVRATTNTGDVFLRLDGEPRQVILRSDIGDLLVELPDGPRAYAVALSTDIGDVVNTVHVDTASSSTIHATTDTGDVTVRYHGP